MITVIKAFGGDREKNLDAIVETLEDYKRNGCEFRGELYRKIQSTISWLVQRNLDNAIVAISNAIILVPNDRRLKGIKEQLGIIHDERTVN
jgi:hypothetical protein